MATKQERQSNGIARRLVKVLEDIEGYDGDPVDILDDAIIWCVGKSVGAKEAVAALINHYSEASHA